MKKFLLFLSPVFVLTTLSGCARTKIDTTNTIYIESFAKSGFGTEWIQDAINNWKEQTEYKGYNVQLLTSTYLAGDQLSQIASGNSVTDIYLGSDPYFKRGFYVNSDGYFEDLTDVINSNAYGETKTIKEKITDFDTWANVGGKQYYNDTDGVYTEDGLYMLPYTITVSAPIFDYDDFVEGNILSKADGNDTDVQAAVTNDGISYTIKNGKLNFVSSTNSTYYLEGDVILTPGPDGKYGTYDDGQPTTEAEFISMYELITAKYDYADIYSDVGPYADSLPLALFAQLNGEEAYYALTTFDSKGKEVALNDGTSEVITYQNGYKAFKQPNVEKSVQFFQDYFYKSTGKRTYIETSSVGNAQTRYLSGLYQNNVPKYAFIYDGNWFEKQAAKTISNAVKSRNQDRYENNLDLRYLVMPTFEGQKGIDGDGHGSFITGPEYGAIVVKKQTIDNKRAAIIDFMKYFLSNEQLANATASTGVVFGYDYSLSKSQLSSMTPFLRASYEITHDEKNVKVLRSRTDKLSSPVNFSSDLNSVDAMSCIYKSNFYNSYGFFKDGGTATNFASLMSNNYNESTWSTLIERMQNYIKK